MSIKVDLKTTIDRAPHDMFAVLTDVAHHTDWAKGPEKIKDVSDSPARLGTTWTQVSRLVGRELDIHARVDGYQPGRTFAYGIDKPFPSHMLWELEPTRSGTNLHVVIEAEQGGFFGVAAPLLRKALKDAVGGDLVTLKNRLEARA
jgi:uncharacterized protein YndB with AHSA1/START domain